MNRTRLTNDFGCRRKKIPPLPPFGRGGNGGIYGKIFGLIILIAAVGVALSACVLGPLTTEKVAKRVKNGQLVTDRSRICMLQDTFQAQSVLSISYNGKTYYG